MGTSTGVKLTRTCSSVRAARFWMISGVCRCVPPTPYADSVAHHLAAEQVRLGRLAGAARAAGRDDHDVGLDEAGRYRRRQGQRRDSRVATGHGDPPRAAQHVALARQLGKPVGPGAGVVAAVEATPRSSRRSSRKSAPQSIDDRVVAERPRRSPPTDRAAGPARPRRDRPGSRPSSARRRDRRAVAGVAGARPTTRRRWRRPSPHRCARQDGRAAAAAPRRRRTRWHRRPQQRSLTCA